ncbi:hypothetical protein EVAR_697_1 [Eumeta japonica]|uniref:Uncharacterized protein n=1 Tax=Eumeta variegata TaxID=151549 RepID=A0A4C1SED7_EUMVA|nr:hypothetical protein EVAR_697_1 [Eumeta japonica]
MMSDRSSMKKSISFGPEVTKLCHGAPPYKRRPVEQMKLCSESGRGILPRQLSNIYRWKYFNNREKTSARCPEDRRKTHAERENFVK